MLSLVSEVHYSVRTRHSGYVEYTSYFTMLNDDFQIMDIFSSLGPDGMERFCIDIGVKPEDIVMLVLAYKMGATQMGFFSQYEWLKGLTELECDTAAKMHAKLDYLKEILNDPNTFRNIYRYAYDFAKVYIPCSEGLETTVLYIPSQVLRHVQPLYLFLQSIYKCCLSCAFLFLSSIVFILVSVSLICIVHSHHVSRLPQ